MHVIDVVLKGMLEFLLATCHRWGKQVGNYCSVLIIFLKYNGNPPEKKIGGWGTFLAHFLSKNINFVNTMYFIVLCIEMEEIKRIKHKTMKMPISSG